MRRRGLAPDEADRALRATLAVIGERLVDDEAKTLASWLPNRLAKVVEDSEYDADFGTRELFTRVARRMRTNPGRALEDAEIVLASLGEALGGERAGRLARALPETAADLVLGKREPDPSAEAPPHPDPRRPPRLSTIATGRPGSKRPLSEARAPAGHTHSVAANDSPHAETKLSTTIGTTQERMQDTLAEGRPPRPARVLGDADD
jgi:uncharacterized protein (DUF2267 family)